MAGQLGFGWSISQKVWMVNYWLTSHLFSTLFKSRCNTVFLHFDLILELMYLSWHHTSRFPDLTFFRIQKKKNSKKGLGVELIDNRIKIPISMWIGNQQLYDLTINLSVFTVVLGIFIYAARRIFLALIRWNCVPFQRWEWNCRILPKIAEY